MFCSKKVFNSFFLYSLQKSENNVFLTFPTFTPKHSPGRHIMTPERILTINNNYQVFIENREM